MSPRVNDGDCRTHLPGTGREVTHFPLYVFSPTARITAAGRRFGSSGDDAATVRIGSRKGVCEPGFKSEFETTALEPAVWSFVTQLALWSEEYNTAVTKSSVNMTTDTDCDVLIVGGGPAGLSAGIFTARAGLDTTLLNDGDPILRRNAHLENYPGFPAGVNSHRLLELMNEQADRAGCDRQEGRVVDLQQSADGFVAETEAGQRFTASNVVAATKNTVEFLVGIDGVEILDRGKSFVDTDDRGRTGVAGLYAAGRLAAQPHQAIIVAGHGATVGVTLIEDSDVDFYHDWVTPEGYFTGRGRELPPGCEEIDADEREGREAESVAAMQEWFAEPHPSEPQQHPSVRDE